MTVNVDNIKVVGVDASQLRDWNRRGLRTRYVERKNEAFVDLQPSEPVLVNELEFPIPPDMVDYARKDTLKTGRAVITCGLSGKPLRAYWVARTARPRRVHARFAVMEQAITLHASVDQESSIVKIRRHRIVHARDRAVLISEDQFEWREEDIPTYHTYSEAAKAAFDKANCVSCIEPHYVNRS